MDPLAVVKPLLHQFDDVRDGLRRFVRVGFKCKRAFGGFNDDDWSRDLSLGGPEKTAEHAEDAEDEENNPHRFDGSLTPIRGHCSRITHAPHRG